MRRHYWLEPLLLAAALAVGFSVYAADGQGPGLYTTKELKNARKLWRKGQLDKAYKAFDKAAKEERGVERLYQIRFLQARVAYDAARWSDAARVFEEVGEALPALEDWSFYYAGKARLEGGENAAAAVALARVSRDSALADDARKLECQSYEKAGENACLVDCVDAYVQAHGEDPGLLLSAARALLDLERTDEAVAGLRRLLVAFPASSQADDASGLLRKLEKRGMKAASVLTAGESLEAAGRLLDAFRQTRALEVAKGVAAREKEGSDAWCRASEVAARAESGRREETRSLPYFQRVLDRCPGLVTAGFLYNGLDSARKAGKKDMARAWTEKLLADYPESTLCDDALVLMARGHAQRGEREELAEIVDRTLAAYPKGDMASEAAWLSVFDSYRAGEHQIAFDKASKYLAALPEREDYRTDGRLLYWMGRCLQKLGRDKDAAGYYVQVLERYPLVWYALLSYLRLEQGKRGTGAKALAAARTKSLAILPTQGAVLAGAAGWKGVGTALMLLEMGLKDEARKELQAVASQGSQGKDRAALLVTALLMDRAGLYSPSHHTLRRKVPEFAYAYPLARDTRWWDIAYPDAFSGPARKAAAAEKLPWPLVQGIIREESGFHPGIESYAHALGLMQLLEKTAEHMAGRKVTAAELKDPEINVPLGARYLRFLWDRFGHPVLVVAGYNSGPGGVAKSLKAAGGTRQVDELVESIPYDQTRRYTKRVLGAAWTYQFLYGAKGMKIVPFPLELPVPEKNKDAKGSAAPRREE